MNDPVCGRTVAEDSGISFNDRGKEYLFCSEGCRRAFAREPEQFLIANTFNYHEIDPIDRFLKKRVWRIDPDIYPFITYRPSERQVRLILDKGGKYRSIRLQKEEIEKAKWDANASDRLHERLKTLVRRLS